MRKISDYRRHAGECRTLARQAASAEQQEQLLNMAATWDSLADRRERAVAMRRHARAARLPRDLAQTMVERRDPLDGGVLGRAAPRDPPIEPPGVPQKE